MGGSIVVSPHEQVELYRFLAEAPTIEWYKNIDGTLVIRLAEDDQ